MNLKLSLTAALLASALVPALAQAQDTPERLVLENKAGNVMVTNADGQYVSAGDGTGLVEGQSLMLGDGARASVAHYYDNGRRRCVETYVGPSTTVIDNRCIPAATSMGVPGSQVRNGLIIAGTALIGAAILYGMDETPAGPLSTGPNGLPRHF